MSSGSEAHSASADGQRLGGSAAARSRSPSIAVRAQSESPPHVRFARAALRRAEAAAEARGDAADDDLHVMIGGAGMEELGVDAARGRVSRRVYVAAAEATAYLNELENAPWIGRPAARAAAEATAGLAGRPPIGGPAAAAAQCLAIAAELESAAETLEEADVRRTVGQLVDLLRHRATQAAAAVAEAAAVADGGGAAASAADGDGGHVLDVILSADAADHVVRIVDHGAVHPRATVRMRQDGPSTVARAVTVRVELQDGRVTDSSELPSGSAQPRPRPRVVRWCATCGQGVDCDNQDLRSNRGRRGYEYDGGWTGVMVDWLGWGVVAGVLRQAISRCAAAPCDLALRAVACFVGPPSGRDAGDGPAGRGPAGASADGGGSQRRVEHHLSAHHGGARERGLDRCRRPSQ